MVALITRARLFGNPVAHIDDQFYLLVGQSMLGGQWPYVDIWDRKPIGLFLIYAAIAALPGNNVLNVQLTASAFAIATAFVIVQIGQRLAKGKGPLLGGIAYLVILPSLAGGSGQSPVFYNLLMSLAGLLTLRSVQEQQRDGSSKGLLLIMGLVGLALLVKPVAVFEGCGFGIALLYVRWRETGSILSSSRLAPQMVAVAVLPTLATFAAYAYAHHLEDIWAATVVSVFAKDPLPRASMLANLRSMSICLNLALGFAVAGYLLILRSDRTTAFFMGCWLVFALIGLAAVPNFFDHYALPLLVPAAALLSPLFSIRIYGWALFAIVTAYSTLWTPRFWSYDGFARREQFDRVVQTVRTNLKGGCLYVYEGPAQLYTSTGACRVTSYVFPDHLNSVIEETALPINQQSELLRALRKRPTVVIDARRVYLEENPKSRAILERELSCAYRFVTTEYSGATFAQPLKIWALRGVTPASKACGSHT